MGKCRNARMNRTARATPNREPRGSEIVLEKKGVLLLFTTLVHEILFGRTKCRIISIINWPYTSCTFHILLSSIERQWLAGGLVHMGKPPRWFSACKLYPHRRPDMGRDSRLATSEYELSKIRPARLHQYLILPSAGGIKSNCDFINY